MYALKIQNLYVVGWDEENGILVDSPNESDAKTFETPKHAAGYSDSLNDWELEQPIDFQIVSLDPWTVHPEETARYWHRERVAAVNAAVSES